jgi:hypothetical protein
LSNLVVPLRNEPHAAGIFLESVLLNRNISILEVNPRNLLQSVLWNFLASLPFSKQELPEGSIVEIVFRMFSWRKSHG